MGPVDGIVKFSEIEILMNDCILESWVKNGIFFPRASYMRRVGKLIFFSLSFSFSLEVRFSIAGVRIVSRYNAPQFRTRDKCVKPRDS